MSLKPGHAVLAVIIVATALRLALGAITDLGLDEAYAFVVSRQLQLSYFDHPPMVFWIAGATQALFGLEAPPILLRLPFIAFSAGTTWLLFRLTVLHFGERAGLWAVLLFTAAPFFFLSAGSWVVPDGPLLFFLAVSALALTSIALDNERRPAWRDWLLAGAALGFALLSKYHAVLFAAGAFLFFLAVPRLRFWLLRPQPYIAVLLAAAIFLPVLVWNAQNEWGSFAFQPGRGQPVAGSTAMLVARLFLTEAAYLLPSTAPLFVAALVFAVLRRRGHDVSSLFFLALALPTIIVLDLTRFWTWQSYAHWAMPGWMFVFPLLGAMLVRWQESWRPAGPIVATLTSLQFVALLGGVVVLLSDFRLRDPTTDDIRLEAGSWTGLKAGLDAVDALEDAAFLVTRRWPDAARVGEALRTSRPVLAFDSDPRGFAWLADQQQLVGRDALIIAGDGETPRLLELYAPYFESFEPVGTYPIEPGNSNRVTVTRGHNLLRPYPLPYDSAR